MTTNRPEFKAHDDFIFKHKKVGKVTREEFIKYIRSSHEHMRKLSELIQQYNQTIDEYLNEWDGRFESFDEDVKDLLGRWIQDGTMDHIINENLMSIKADKEYVDELHDSTTAQLAQKVTKGRGEITDADLSQGVKEQMTGGSVSVVGTNAVNDINMYQGAASAYEIKEIKKSKNLFNKDRFTEGFVLDALDGYSTTPSSGVGYSDFIRVTPGSTLYKNKMGSVIVYDENKTRLTGSKGMAFGAGVFEVPQNAHYIRVNVVLLDVYSYQIEYGEEPSSYENGVMRLDKSIKIGNENIIDLDGTKLTDGSVPLTKMNSLVTSSNILNPNDIVENTYVARHNGELVEHKENYSFSSVIITSENEHLKIKPVELGAVNYAFYDVDNTYVSGGQILPDSDDWVVSIPSQAIYLSISFGTVEYEPMVSYGTEEKEYEPFYQYFKDIIYPDEGHEDAQNTKKTHLSGKRIVCFGDSITGSTSYPNDYPAFIAERLGATVYNVGFNGARMSTDESQTAHDAYSMVQLADAVASNDYSIQIRELGVHDRHEEKLNTLLDIDFNDVDIVTIMYGTNDFSSSIPQLDNPDDEMDRTTVLGGARYAIKTLQEAYPHLKIVLLSTMWRTVDDGESPERGPADTTQNTKGEYMIEYVEGLETVADYHHIPFVNMYNGLGINQYNYSEYLFDGLHPDPKGRKLIGDRLASQLLSKI